MKNDITYEYRVFTNRLIDVESMEIGRCTSKVINEIKPKDKVNGRFFHTSDTDEWFFCWNDELQKLNLKGDSDVNAALSEVKKLIVDANDAVEDAKKTAADAQKAAEDANAAVESIENKADKSEIDVLAKMIEDKVDVSVVEVLSKKVDAIETPSLDGYATESFVIGEIEKIIVPTKVSELENDSNYLTVVDADLKYAPIGSEGVDLSNYATKEYVTDEIEKIVVPTKVSELENDVNYLTEHQDISGKQDVISDLENIRRGAELGAKALQEIPVEYITEEELAGKSFITIKQVEEKNYATESFVSSEIEKINIPDVPTKVSELENDVNYLTEQSLNGYATESFVNEEIGKIIIPDVPSMDDYYSKDEVDSKIKAINDLIGDANEYIINTIMA